MGLVEEQGVKSEEMYKTFNMGVGFCVISPKENVEQIKSIFKKYKISSQEIGHIIPKTGVYVKTKKIA